jgi:hypothetical protein
MHTLKKIKASSSVKSTDPLDQLQRKGRGLGKNTAKAFNTLKKIRSTNSASEINDHLQKKRRGLLDFNAKAIKKRRFLEDEKNENENEKNQLNKKEDRQGRNIARNPPSSYEFDQIKNALLKHEELYGNMLVDHSFVVPMESNEWPIDMGGMKLGWLISDILCDPEYKSYRDKLFRVWFRLDNEDNDDNVEGSDRRSLGSEDMSTTLDLKEQVNNQKSIDWQANNEKSIDWKVDNKKSIDWEANDKESIDNDFELPNGNVENAHYTSISNYPELEPNGNVGNVQYISIDNGNDHYTSISKDPELEPKKKVENVHYTSIDNVLPIVPSCNGSIKRNYSQVLPSTSIIASTSVASYHFPTPLSSTSSASSSSSSLLRRSNDFNTSRLLSNITGVSLTDSLITKLKRKRITDAVEVNLKKIVPKNVEG